MPKPKRAFRLPHPEPVDALAYTRFTGIPTFMRLPHITDPAELEVALVGIPFDGMGCDLVEVSPPFDTGEITSPLAANLLFELLCVL